MTGSLVEFSPRAARFESALDAALQVLATATTPSDLTKLADTAEALRIYARRAELGLVAQNKAAELRRKSERRIGEYLVQNSRKHGSRPLDWAGKSGSLEIGSPELSGLRKKSRSSASVSRTEDGTEQSMTTRSFSPATAA